MNGHPKVPISLRLLGRVELVEQQVEVLHGGEPGEALAVGLALEEQGQGGLEPRAVLPSVMPVLDLEGGLTEPRLIRREVLGDTLSVETLETARLVDHLVARRVELHVVIEAGENEVVVVHDVLVEHLVLVLVVDHALGARDGVLLDRGVRERDIDHGAIGERDGLPSVVDDVEVARERRDDAKDLRTIELVHCAYLTLIDSVDDQEPFPFILYTVLPCL